MLNNRITSYNVCYTKLLRPLIPLWELLDAAGADVVISAHNHVYQRWAPQDAHGNAASDGVVQFTVGTGGRSLYPYGLGSVPENLVATQNKSFGLLKLTLHRDSYDYEWVTLPGDATFTDSDASVSCH